MRKAYRDALEATSDDVEQLGLRVRDALASAVTSLQTGELDAAARVIGGDDEINAMRRRVEQSCIELIWRQQPVAGELRRVAAMLDIVTDLERIGDYAAEIGRFAIRLADLGGRPARLDVGVMGNIVVEMLTSATEAYAKRDEQIADRVIARDDEVDALYAQAIDAIQEMMQADSESVPAGTLMVFVYRNLERAADRALNVAWATKTIADSA